MNQENNPGKSMTLFKAYPFQLNRQLQRTAIPKRLSKFVVIPGNPIHLKPDLSGATPIRISPHYLELIQMAESTLLVLSADSTRPGRVCPKAIFSQKNSESDRYTVSHQLKTYLRELQNEKQHALEFHFVGHGTPNEIGLSMWQRGVSDIEFAEQIKSMLEEHELVELAFPLRPMHFVFHTCNSAYCNIDASMKMKDVHAAIKNESFIGHFYAKMKHFGFKNISVSGFRGYYSHALSHKSSMVTDAYDYHTVLLPADSAKFTIFSDEQVQMPSNRQGCFMPIRLTDPVIEANIEAEEKVRTDLSHH